MVIGVLTKAKFLRLEETHSRIPCSNKDAVKNILGCNFQKIEVQLLIMNLKDAILHV